jgi:uncharacterized protein Yka (UPF0111/DUF47 family)
VGLDKKDLQMMSVLIPVVDWWDIQEEIDRLEDIADRLERIAEVFLALYKEERTKNWEIVLQTMMKKHQNGKGKWE